MIQVKENYDFLKRELQEKEEHLQSLFSKKEQLINKADELKKQIKEIEDNIETCEKKLFNSEKLISGIDEQVKRWQDSDGKLRKKKQNILAYSLLASGFTCYLSFMSPSLRQGILESWIDVLLVFTN